MCTHQEYNSELTTNDSANVMRSLGSTVVGLPRSVHTPKELDESSVNRLVRAQPFKSMHLMAAVDMRPTNVAKTAQVSNAERRIFWCCACVCVCSLSLSLCLRVCLSLSPSVCLFVCLCVGGGGQAPTTFVNSFFLRATVSPFCGRRASRTSSRSLCAPCISTPTTSCYTASLGSPKSWSPIANVMKPIGTEVTKPQGAEVTKPIGAEVTKIIGAEVTKPIGAKVTKIIGAKAVKHRSQSNESPHNNTSNTEYSIGTHSNLIGTIYKQNRATRTKLQLPYSYVFFLTHTLSLSLSLFSQRPSFAHKCRQSFEGRGWRFPCPRHILLHIHHSARERIRVHDREHTGGKCFFVRL
jgi:hypothetical protein